MQRQSLGSPSSKLVKDEQIPSQSSSSAPSTGSECREEEEEQLKKLKPKATTTTPQSYIHLIPILTLLCFLILYLSSHDPSLKDLAEFNGINTASNSAESIENISEMQRILEIKRGDILAVRSLKNLNQEAFAAKQRRRHRKIPYF